VAQRLEEKFENRRTLITIQAKARSHKTNTSRFNNERWTEDQDEFVKLLKIHGTPQGEWAQLFRGKFGFLRSEMALRARLTMLVLTTGNPNKIRWTDDEKTLIREFIPLNLGHYEICDRFWKRFGTKRSQSSINRKSLIIKRSLNDDEHSVLSKQRWWTSDEEKFMSDWSGRLMDLFAAFCQKFGTHRTAVTITNIYYLKRERKGQLAA
jgi:hypothetical protein